MNVKTQIASVVALAAFFVTSWKGPSVWGVVSFVVLSACVLALPILRAKAENDPKLAKLEEYVADLEDELESVPGAGANLSALKAKHGRPQ